MFLFFALLLAPVLLLLLLIYFIVRPRPVNIPIKGRHVFITGGSKGIGLALAQRAVLEGARVSLLARSLPNLEEAQKSIRLTYGIDVAIFSADVRDYDAVQRAAVEAGPIDVLVVNHGVFLNQELEKQGLDVVKLMIDVNLMGSFNVIKAALPLMKGRKDRHPAAISLMSSQAGQVKNFLLKIMVTNFSKGCDLLYMFMWKNRWVSMATQLIHQLSLASGD